MTFHYRGLECKSRKSRNTWSNRQIWPWNTEWSRTKANRVLPREGTGNSKQPLPTTQEKTLHMCWGPLMGQNLVVRSQGSESTGVKEADIPWFTQKANKAPARGLLCSRRPQTPCQWGEGAEHLLKRVLEAWAGKWTQRASALQGINLKKRGRESERKKEKERHGDQSSDGAKVF